MLLYGGLKNTFSAEISSLEGRGLYPCSSTADYTHLMETIYLSLLHTGM